MNRHLTAQVRHVRLENAKVLEPLTAADKALNWAWLGIFMLTFVPFLVMEFLGLFWRHGFFENETLSEIVHRIELTAPPWVRWVVFAAVWLFGTWLALHLAFDWPV